jgi:hypothetical protein
MGKSPNTTKERKAPEGTVERGSRWYRNVNYLGAAAFTGAAVLLPELAIPFLAIAALDVAQAVGADVVRGHAKNRRLKKLKAQARSS